MFTTTGSSNTEIILQDRKTKVIAQ